ncbi:MAG: hypothetical protein HY897_06095 [Deltaproteobacteria bacterium]|nr:hypothetical protein [Deltaproteobacteria bacterium]
MKITVDKGSFWFLQKGATLELSDERQLDMLVQQVFARGREADLNRLFSLAGTGAIKGSLRRIRRFLPVEVRAFWEEYFENIDQSAA